MHDTLSYVSHKYSLRQLCVDIIHLGTGKRHFVCFPCSDGDAVRRSLGQEVVIRNLEILVTFLDVSGYLAEPALKRVDGFLRIFVEKQLIWVIPQVALKHKKQRHVISNFIFYFCRENTPFQ